MKATWRARNILVMSVLAASAATVSLSAVPSALASSSESHEADSLLLSRTEYVAPAGTIVPGTTKLPAGCTTGCVTAVADGGYPEVFNNEKVDASFGVSSPIFLDRLSPSGATISTRAVPTNTGRDHLVTSFPSKSELGLNVSTGGDAVTFMGYVAPVNQLDVSNSNTPAVVDPTNPVGVSYYRAVATLHGEDLSYTETNAYSGNNGRAALLNTADHVIYTAGNAGNGANPQPVGVIAGAGAQILSPAHRPESLQNPAAPTPVGAFSITQLGRPADKVGKDTNFRGLTVFNNVEYLTKGSGGNGVNTVYFIDTTGTACPTGVGLPVPGAALPTSPISYDPATVQANGLPTNMCILKGFPTALKSTTSFPFGIWFANSTTLYVADEGNGTATYNPATGTYTAAAGQIGAGLQKWVLANGTWTLAYTMNAGLGLGAPYSVAGYPTGINAVTGLPWAPATDGLRNITGRVNRDGTATIWGITSTVSGATDMGADPNRLVSITDQIGAAAVGSEQFSTLRTAQSGEALRGIVLAPHGDE